jgi:hypothetical protein
VGTFDYDAGNAQPLPDAPEHAIWIGNTLGHGIDRQLGYRGERRFVLFYFEPRGEEIIWQDCDSYGFGLGGWRAFMDRIEPLLEQYNVSIGDLRSHGRHALIVDRMLGQAYLTPRKSAEQFVLQRCEP